MSGKFIKPVAVNKQAQRKLIAMLIEVK